MRRTARRKGFWPALIFVAALLPRLSALGRYVTPDELNWVYRSIGLRQALLSGDWASTLQSGHPGVTTTWIGAAAVQAQLWLREGAGERLAWLEKVVRLSQDNVEAYRRLAFFLDGGRLGVALITALGIVAVYLVGRRVLGKRAAAAGSLFLALDPFFAGLSGLLHVDGLLAIFMALALLLALAAAETRGGGRDAALAGVCTGLALLSKTPALLLLPFIPAIFLWDALRRPAEGESRRWPWRPLLLWGGGLIASALILLPALWAAPLATLETVAGLSGRLAGDAVRPTFFLGDSVLDPGPLFYPVVVLFRLSPATVIGLLLLAPAWKTFRAQRGDGATRPVGWFLLFAMAFLIFISFVAKKHDRYALPTLVALTLAAGWGMGLLAGRGDGKGWRRRIAPTLICLQAAYLVLYLPYPLMAYNWLAGGGDVAARALPAGWGEGVGAGARWLAETAPSPEAATLFTTSTTGAAPFFPGEIFHFDRSTLPLLEADDYILLVQRDGQVDASLLPEGRAPLQRVAFKGATRARVYEGVAAADFGVPSLEMAAQEVTFGGEVGITAAGAVPAAWPERMLVGVTWERPEGGAPSAAYQARLLLMDEAERVRASREWPLLNRADQAPRHWPAGAPQTVYYTFQPPADLPPGEYGVAVEVFNAQGERLGAFDSGGRFQGVRPRLETVTIGPRTEEPTLEIPNRVAGDDELAGYAPWPEEVGSGETLTLDLWWRAETPGQGELLLLLGDAELATTLDTRAWRPGQIYHIRPAWRLPRDVEAGQYDLRLQWVEEGGRRWPAPVVLGEIEVAARERTFELPAEVTPLNARLGTVAVLQEATVEWGEGALLLHVVWQGAEPDGAGYTTFVHLRDETGKIVGQVDRPPEPPTSSWLPGQVVMETYRLARPAAGGYTVALGLYDAASGRRLPVYDASGERRANDQFLMEVTAP
ncbi:MAG: glycosyltransferase family 39 protein [Candidatus Promineifilaceae bacterium]|nr:glycosyltransferase family 39 protein [Candidatus Promineifilaceae bacterium]